MSNGTDTYQLEAIAADHPLAVEVFVPSIARLRAAAELNAAVLAIRTQMAGEASATQHALRLSWFADSAVDTPFAVQEHVVTEWAALGVACVVLARYSTLRLRAVTVRGDRFDYWVSDGRRDYGLEVSGTISGGLESRHREKVSQLLENPYRVDGFAIAVGFSPPAAICSFHRFGEDRG
jgi:hypothetical protein